MPEEWLDTQGYYRVQGVKYLSIANGLRHRKKVCHDGNLVLTP